MGVHQLDPYKVQEIRTLGKREDVKAKALLEQVAKQVQPLLRRHKLTVPLVTEFFPTNPNLLGLNIGGGGGSTSEIRIRLRRHGRELDFFEYTHVLGTMLHEITHNHHGRHDAAFYKLLDKYTEECEELITKGISGSGAGFDAVAAGKVGGRFHGRGELPPHQRRELALKAAEERLKKQILMPSGPRKLGGDLTLRLTCDPGQAAAIAAQRRARDNLWCPTEHIDEEAAAGHNVDSAIQQVLDNAGGASTAQAVATAQDAAGQRMCGSAVGAVSGAGGSALVNLPSNSTERGHQESQHYPQQQQQQQHAARTESTFSAPSMQQEAHGTDFIDLTDNGDEENACPLVCSRSRRSHSGAIAAAAAACTAAGASGQVAPPPKRHRLENLPRDSITGLPEQQQLWQHEQLLPRGEERVFVWACPACTLLNKAIALQCDACGCVKPAGFTAGSRLGTHVW